MPIKVYVQYTCIYLDIGKATPGIVDMLGRMNWVVGGFYNFYMYMTVSDLSQTDLPGQ